MSRIFHLTLLGLFTSLPAWACSCVDDKLPEDRKIARSYTQATFVLTGRVLKAEPVTTVDSVRAQSRFSGRDTVYTNSRQEISYTFAITKLLKGKKAEATVMVRSAASSAACGAQFALGTEYLVYGFTVDQQPGPDGTLRKTAPYYATSLCHRHQALRAVKSSELRQLRRIAQKASGEHKLTWFELLD